MKKLIIFLFSICISFNSYSGIFSETICFETDGQSIVFLPNDINPYTGKYLCKYENGQKKKEGRYKNGRLIGKWTVWSETIRSKLQRWQTRWQMDFVEQERSKGETEKLQIRQIRRQID